MDAWNYFIYFLIASYVRPNVISASTTKKSELECEFPPKMEEDLTHVRRKRLTTESGLVCLEDYPYTVSIRLHGKHWCGGAIVGIQWILTAAQCFDYVSKEEVTVRMGSVFRDYGGRILSVTDIQRHPEYRTDQYYPEHNIALIKVNIPIVPNSRIQPVSLAPSNADLPPLFGEIVVTGYGSVATGQIRDGENQELRRMIVKTVPKSQCRLEYGNDYHLQHDHMCLQSAVKGVALCAGDTGDPAVHFSGMNRAGTLFGIALFSGTEECAFKSKPGVYAKVSFSRAWIDKVLNETERNESVESGENAIPIDMVGLSRQVAGKIVLAQKAMILKWNNALTMATLSDFMKNFRHLLDEMSEYFEPCGFPIELVSRCCMEKLQTFERYSVLENQDYFT